ncbi:hypothetical protein AMS68_002367 [Peltaster fructicola]|uniref:Uncharacterized protein n=1 Tax=Peltaster fructicola TaxID=286661 RepID=A0A6H0XQV6_9PEZI|nr:hypothetical protein AMS68_002367 [Peltaster fructicola]
MTTTNALQSDHVNYLIFRYLQESGHEDTAKSFWRDWNRPRDFRDPESFPFARHVHHRELVTVIQDGLRHDELRARVTKSECLFKWSLVDPGRSGDSADAEINGSRPSSSGKRKSIGTGARQSDDSTAPAVKRPRLSGPDHQINGHREAMDIDGGSSSVEDNEDDTNAVSPAVASDGTGDALTMRYDSVATQTEVANGQIVPVPRLKARSIVLDINKPSSKIFHAAWNPNKSGKSRNTLFVTGESLCRMYQTPDRLNGATHILEHIDEPAVSDDCMVTGMTWHPAGRMLTCAVDTVGPPRDGKQKNTRRVISIGPDVGGTYTHFPTSELLQPPGVALHIEYSPSGEYLMLARTNGDRGVVEIWPAVQSQLVNAPTTQPLAWKLFDHSLSDAAWSGDRQLMVCTHTEHAWSLKLADELSHSTSFTAETIASHNLEERSVVLPPCGEVDITYMNDATHNIDVFFVRPYDQESGQDKMVVVDSTLYDTEAYLKARKTFPLDWSFVTFVAQPARETIPEQTIRNYGPARLLATVAENGGCRLFELGRDSNGLICKPLFNQDGYTLKMSYGSALAAAWSPNGEYIAIAGTGLVQVWQAAAPDSIESRAVLTWRINKSSPQETEDVRGMDRESSRPVSLTWDSLSQKICFAIDSKVTIIELEDSEEPMDGIQPT